MYRRPRRLAAARVADEPDGDDHDLTEASAAAEVRAVDRTPRGYVIRLSDAGAMNYASGLHADRWLDVGYVVNASSVTPVALHDRNEPVRAGSGTTVVDCR